MAFIGRREILKGAVAGTLLCSQLPAAKALTDLKDLEGRAVNTISDPANMSALEREHLITIEVPGQINAGQPFNVSVNLPDHPSLGNHHITWLRLLVDNMPVCYMTFAPGWQKPAATLTFVLTRGQRMDAVAECSIHGLWGASAPLNITFESEAGAG